MEKIRLATSAVEEQQLEREERDFKSTLPRTRRLIEQGCGDALGNPVIQGIVDAATSASAVVKRMKDLGWSEAIRQARYCYYLKEQYNNAWEEAKVVEPGYHPADTLYGFSPIPDIKIARVVWNNKGRPEELDPSDPSAVTSLGFQASTKMGDQVLEADIPILAREARVELPQGLVLTTFDGGPEARREDPRHWDTNDYWRYLNPLSFDKISSLSRCIPKKQEGGLEEDTGWRFFFGNTCGWNESWWHRGISVGIHQLVTMKASDGFPHWYKLLEILQKPEQPSDSPVVMNRIHVLLRTDPHPKSSYERGMVMFERLIEMSLDNRGLLRYAVVRALYHIREYWRICQSWSEDNGRFSAEPSVHISMDNSFPNEEARDRSSEVMAEAAKLLQRVYKQGYDCSGTNWHDMDGFLGQVVLDDPYRDLLDVFVQP